MSGLMGLMLNSASAAVSPPPPAPSFATATIAPDPGNAAFTTLYSGGPIDEGGYFYQLSFNFIFQGVNYSKLGISSNSYIIFGTNSTSFIFPNYIWQASSPAFPGIGVCANPNGTSDTAVTFIGYRNIDASTCQLRWQGTYPYNGAVNRLWDMTFYSGSNLIRLDMYQISSRDASGTGSYITTKSASAFLSNSTPPTDNTAFILTC